MLSERVNRSSLSDPRVKTTLGRILTAVRHQSSEKLDCVTTAYRTIMKGHPKNRVTWVHLNELSGQQADSRGVQG
jgi:hypothetical protein